MNIIFDLDPAGEHLPFANLFVPKGFLAVRLSDGLVRGLDRNDRFCGGVHGCWFPAHVRVGVQAARKDAGVARDRLGHRAKTNHP